MVYGYVRTDDPNYTQDSWMSVQEEALKRAGVQEIVTDIGGCRCKQPELEKLLKRLQKGDRLIVASLSRLSRNSKKGLTIMLDLREKGIELYSEKECISNLGPNFLQLAEVIMRFAENEIPRRCTSRFSGQEASDDLPDV